MDMAVAVATRTAPSEASRTLSASSDTARSLAPCGRTSSLATYLPWEAATAIPPRTTCPRPPHHPEPLLASRPAPARPRPTTRPAIAPTTKAHRNSRNLRVTILNSTHHLALAMAAPLRHTPRTADPGILVRVGLRRQVRPADTGLRALHRGPTANRSTRLNSSIHRQDRQGVNHPGVSTRASIRRDIEERTENGL